MASTSANAELAGPLAPPAAGTSPTTFGRLRVGALRLAATIERHPLAGVAVGVATGAAATLAWAVAALAHELLVLLMAVALPILTGLPAIQGVLALLPINYVYAAAAVRYAGQIEPAGLALAGPVGVALAEAWPGLFYDPSYVAGEGLLSGVIAPGSSVMAQVIASTVANALLLALGVALTARATRGSRARWLVHLGPRRWPLLALGMAVQAEVAIRVLRAPGSSRDLETLGVLPFIFHELLRLPGQTYDRAMFQLSRLVDPIFAEVVLLALYGALIGLWVLARVVRRARREGIAGLRPARAMPPWLASGPNPARLAVEASLIVVLVAATPLGDALNVQTRFLEMGGASDWSSEVPPMPVPGTIAVPPLEPPPTLPAPISPPVSIVPPVVLVPPLSGSANPPVAITRSAEVPARSGGPAPAQAAPAPAVARPSVVSIGGRSYNYTYVVNGVPTEFRGMGYNVTHAGLPPAERAERLRRDFALMREIGVNTVVGWRTAEWDEAVLDAAQAAGIGVVLPYDLDDKLDYSDRAVRFRVRSDVLAWVARFRSHPAIRIWGLGNETLLNMKQAARAKAFADFYVQLVDAVRQLDPEHPILYREAEDLYLRQLQDAWGKNGPPQGFVVGMNFYTFRMRDAIEGWPKRGMDAPLVISEFAPAGVGRGERAAGYWRMWAMIRARPEYVLGAAPYVWNAEGPEPVDRLFGLTDGAARPVDSSIGTLKDMYSLPLPTDSGPTVATPPVLGLRLDEARAAIEARGLKLAAVTYQSAADLADPGPIRFYGAQRVIRQQPDPAARVAPGSEVRLAIGTDPPMQDYPRRPRAE